MRGDGRQRSGAEHANVGNFVFTVNTRDSAGNPETVTSNYSVVAAHGARRWRHAADAEPDARHAGSFTAFIPGLARDYNDDDDRLGHLDRGERGADRRRSQRDRAGALVNGAFSLTNPLQVGAVSTYEYAVKPMLPAGNVGTSAAPRALLNYNGPVGLDAVTLNFKQTIAETEALRTGGYSKTLTFTLSTTQPVVGTRLDDEGPLSGGPSSLSGDARQRNSCSLPRRPMGAYMTTGGILSMKRLRARLSYANIVASLALFVALGGVSYAAATLPKDSVGPTQLRADAVRTGKIDDGAVTSREAVSGGPRTDRARGCRADGDDPPVPGERQARRHG